MLNVKCKIKVKSCNFYKFSLLTESIKVSSRVFPLWKHLFILYPNSWIDPN